jgi:UDP-N-acetylmuramate dehydrogenase
MAEVRTGVPLAPLTTLRLGGPARRLVEARTEQDLVAAVRRADDRGEDVLILAGGSNLVLADEGWRGTVVLVRTRGLASHPGPGGSVLVEIAAGEEWDDVVAAAVEGGLAGIECLSGIPGSAGATPIQNVGAYGQEIATTLDAVRVLDRATGEVEELGAAALGLGYRQSRFKGQDTHVVLGVRLRLERTGTSEPIRYAELARALGVEPGERVELAAAREAVLALRRGKGMVLELGDPDAVSAGSFFTNPVLSPDAFARLEARAAERLGPEDRPPAFPDAAGHIKTSAAWLIERAGFHRGHAHPRGRVAISSKHTLALTNRGGASAAELVELAVEIARGVREAFGVELHPEPVFAGHDWPGVA